MPDYTIKTMIQQVQQVQMYDVGKIEREVKEVVIVVGVNLAALTKTEQQRNLVD